MADLTNKIVVADNIYLDTIKAEDKERLVSLANDPIMRKNVGDTLPSPYTEKDADWWINHSQGLSSNSSLENKQFGIYIGGEYAGNMGREQKEKGRKAHNYRFGYRIGRPYRGNGYMTKIVEVFTKYMFDTIPNCHRIYAAVYGRNKASARVLEKNGFHPEGIRKEAIERDGEFHDELFYAKLKE